MCTVAYDVRRTAKQHSSIEMAVCSFRVRRLSPEYTEIFGKRYQRAITSSKDRGEAEEPNRYIGCPDVEYLHVRTGPGQEVGGLSLTSCAYLHLNSKATRAHGLGFFLSSRPFDLVLDLSRSKQAKQSKAKQSKARKARAHVVVLPPRSSPFLPPSQPSPRPLIPRCSRARFELERPLATTISAEF
jgi:hypothetical protein